MMLMTISVSQVEKLPFLCMLSTPLCNYFVECSGNLLISHYLQNPWDVIQFSGNAQIHLDSFLSIFNISGLPEEFYYNSKATTILSQVIVASWKNTLFKKPCALFMFAGRLSNGEDAFIDGAVIAAARTLPTWSDGDTPPIPSIERKAARELHEECQQILAKFPTTSDEDQRILGTMLNRFIIPIFIFLCLNVIEFLCIIRNVSLTNQGEYP